jgi:hypothetical protein
MAENYPMECANLPEVRIITQSSYFSMKNAGFIPLPISPVLRRESFQEFHLKREQW